MIKVNNIEIKQGTFPDGTPLIKMPSLDLGLVPKFFAVQWYYDNMAELFNLQCIVEKIRAAYPAPRLSLYMPYVPNARQDRMKEEYEDVFTLKTFCNIINSLNFEKVTIMDAHSDVSPALLNNVRNLTVGCYLEKIINIHNIDLIFYPDNGAMHKYSSYIGFPCCYGLKKRDWSTGEILGLEIVGDVKDKNILFIDDIISYGGSLYFSTKKLKELGAKNICAYITHTENSFFNEEKGRAKDILGTVVERLYTTDSIYRLEQDRVTVVSLGEE